ncbi:unknown [Collinsella sp. CAG:166]|nr:unknown [Collinsella sp. CAG:166]
MVGTHKNVRRGAEEPFEHELVGCQHALNDLAVVLGQVQDAQLAFHVRDILDNLVSLLLAQGKVVARGIELADYVNKCVNGKGIMLTAHTKVWHLLGRALVLAFEQIGLIEHLSRVAQEGLALLGHNDTLVGALKDMHTHLVFEIADRCGNRRLRHKEPARGLGNAAAFGNFDDISELLKLHSFLPRRS